MSLLLALYNPDIPFALDSVLKFMIPKKELFINTTVCSVYIKTISSDHSYSGKLQDWRGRPPAQTKLWSGQGGSPIL